MNIKRALFAALAVAALAGGTAKAGTAIMASSGHPWVGGSGDISGSWGAFNIGDAQVCANNSGSWVIPIPVPTSTGAVTHTITVDYGPGTTAEAWSFRTDGSVYSGRSISASNASRSISVPAGGTLFAKGVMSSALAPACINTTVLVN